jgi:hypothetical protein
VTWKIWQPWIHNMPYLFQTVIGQYDFSMTMINPRNLMLWVVIISLFPWLIFMSVSLLYSVLHCTLYILSKFNNNKLMFTQSFILKNTQLKLFMNSVGPGFEMGTLASSVIRNGWDISIIIFGRSFVCVCVCVYIYIYIYTGCFTTCGQYCRRWFPRSLWSKKVHIKICSILDSYGVMTA